MYLMWKDNTVIEFDKSNCQIIHNKKSFIPYPLLNNLSLYEVERWISQRFIPEGRSHSKAILNKLEISNDRLVMSTVCKGASLTDNYWFRQHNNDTKWEAVSLFKNPIPESVAELAITGLTDTDVSGELQTPELTTQGVYAKCWTRENSMIYLNKANSSKGIEAQNERACSIILRALKYNHVDYEISSFKGLITSKCRLMTSENLSLLSVFDFEFYAETHKIDTIKWVIANYKKDFWKMMLFDGIVHNTDRHTGNWGFILDSTRRIKGLHPLMDHNNALNMSSEKRSVVLPDYLLIEAACKAYKELGRPRELTSLGNWLASTQTKYFFNKLFNSNTQWEFISDRVNKIITS